MLCDIIIKSYPGDYEWLRYALRSIAKFASGFSETIVITPFGSPPPTGVLERVDYVQERGDGYLWQQACKMNFDAFSDADAIYVIDSDTIFTRPFTPDDYIVKGRIKWFYTPYTAILSNGDGSYTWKEPTENFIGQPIEHELMRRPPQVFPRWALPTIRKFCWRMHGINIEEYILSRPERRFSEWNALGAYLWYHHHDEIEWINTEAAPLEPPFVMQGFSWGGLTPETRAAMEALLQ